MSGEWGSAPGEKGLKVGAISFVSNVVIGTASVGLTGLACVLYYRRALLGSVKSLVFAGVLPLLGFLSLAAVFVKAWHDYSQPGFNYSNPVLGIQVPIAMGIGGLVLGGLLMLWAWARYRGFFRRRLEVAPPDALQRPPAMDVITPEMPPPAAPTGIA